MAKWDLLSYGKIILDVMTIQTQLIMLNCLDDAILGGGYVRIFNDIGMLLYTQLT